MGTQLYGVYGFLSNFFRNIIQFFDLFISPGFYVIYNKKKQQSLIIFAHYYIFIVFLFNIILIVLVTSNFTLSHIIFREAKTAEIILMAVLAFINWIILIYANVFDSNNRTVFFEKNRIFAKIFLIFFFSLVILLTIKFNVISVALIFILSNLFLVAVSFVKLFKPSLFYWRHVSSIFYKSLTTLVHYNGPLIAFSICSVIITQSEIVMVNYFYGADEMSYLAFSYQIGVLIFVFSSSLVPLIIKKYVDKIKKNDLLSIRRSFSNEVSYLFYLIAFFSIFLFFQAEGVLSLVAGVEYLPGLDTFKLYSLYPMHQTLGQISSAFFLASNRVRIYSRVNITITIIFALLSLYFILPINYGGIEMGSKGLVIKMLLSQIFSVYILLFIIYKSLNKNYYQLIFNHIKVIGSFLLVAYLLDYGLNQFFANEILSVTINLALYVVICLSLLFGFNGFFDLPNLFFKSIINFIKSVFHD